jgi:hypothetical protein
MGKQVKTARTIAHAMHLYSVAVTAAAYAVIWCTVAYSYGKYAN